MPHTLSVTIPYNQAERNAQGMTVVPFDPDVVGNEPIVLLQPFWTRQPNLAVGYVPVVQEITTVNGVPTVIIFDQNYADDYFLNVLLIRVNAPDIHGLPALPSLTPVDSPGQYTLPGIKQNGQATPQVNLLTAGRFSTGPMSVVSSSPGTRQDYSDVVVNVPKIAAPPNNRLDTYLYNTSAVIQTLPHAAQSGIVKKSGDVTRVTFPAEWNYPPIVFVTPMAASNPAEVEQIETVTNVTSTYFESYSQNTGDDLSLQWLAVTANPNFHRNHVETGVDHVLKQFADNTEITSFITDNRAQLVNAIVNDTPAPSNLANLRLSTAPPPPPTEFLGEKLWLDIAGLLIDILGFVVLYFSDQAATALKDKTALANALATTLEGREEEVRGVMNEATHLFASAQSATDAVTKARRTALLLLSIGSGLFTLGVVKTILSSLLSSLSTVQWVIIAIKIAAQFAAIVLGFAATAGALDAVILAAWVARFCSLLTSTVGLASDIYSLVVDIFAELNSSSPSPSPT